MNLPISDTSSIVNQLKNNSIGVMPSDTIYGIHCLASKPELLAKVAKIKDRSEDMPFIILISDMTQLNDLGFEVDNELIGTVSDYWPGRNTLILTNSIGIDIGLRLPDSEFLFKIINETGPLVSTSANKHGQPPASNIQQAQDYFGDEIDFYVDGGTIESQSSSIYKITDGEITQIR